MAIAPVITGSLSTVCSLTIIYTIFHRRRRKSQGKRKQSQNGGVVVGDGGGGGGGGGVQRLGVYQRLLLVMLSVSDIIFSIGKLTSVWMVPQQQPPPQSQQGTNEDDRDDDVWGATGNVATCTIQGAMKQLGISAALYKWCIIILLSLVNTIFHDGNQLCQIRRTVHSYPCDWVSFTWHYLRYFLRGIQ